MKIQGGIPLTGEIWISGAKNSALPCIAATLLTKETIILKNVPHLTDISNMVSLMRNQGAQIAVNGATGGGNNELTCNSVSIQTVASTVSEMRASIYLLGPLVSRFGSARIRLPIGGCPIGARGIELHLDLLTALGATIDIEEDYLVATAASRLKGAVFTFPKVRSCFFGWFCVL